MTHHIPYRQAIPAALFLLILSCGVPSSPVAHATPTQGGAQAATSSNSLNCRLPVAGFTEPTKAEMIAGAQSGQKGTGGFLELPSGKYSSAADSDVTYLADARVWLPVSQQSIAPDGKSFVVARAPAQSLQPPTTTLFMVDVKTRQEHVLFTPPAENSAFVLAYTAAGVYVEFGRSQPSPGQASTFGLLRIDPATGKQVPVPGADKLGDGVMYQAWTAVAGDAAWGMAMTGSQSQASYELVRMSLSDGSRASWYTAASPFALIGFDWNDHPVVQAFGQTSAQSTGATLVSILSAKKTVSIEVKGGSFLPGRGQAVKDIHGIWFGSGDGSIWLLTPEGQMTKVATVPPQPGGSSQPYDPHSWRSVAGPCV
jgi:hypothetical protein